MTASPAQDHGDDMTALDGASPRGAEVSARFVWLLVGGIALAGAVVLALLAFAWRTGRISGIDNVRLTQPGQIAAYAGAVPSGGSRPLEAPRSVSTDGARIYVTEPDAARVSVFTTSGRFVRRVTVQAGGRVYPVDAVALGGTLYVADTAGKRLLAMPVAGGATRRVAASLTAPTALATSGNDLMVADAETGLWRFDPRSGKTTRVASAEATKGFAGGIAVDGERVLLSDAAGSRVLDVSIDGGDIAAFGERVNLPRGIAVDGGGRVWVADVFGGSVVVFDASGVALGDMEREEIAGPEPARIESPQGIAFAPSESRLWVVDSAAGRVLAYTVAR